MNLYCESCHEVHWIPPSSVEALVYALEAMQREDLGVTRPEPDEPTCLNALVSLALSVEGYSEHVEANRFCRRRHGYYRLTTRGRGSRPNYPGRMAAERAGVDEVAS